MVKIQDLANNDIKESLSHHNVLPEYKNMTVEERKEVCDNDRLPFQVAILNVTGELNTSTIIRTSLLMGAEKVFIIGRRRYDKRGTVGADFYIDVERIDALLDEVTLDCKRIEELWSEMNIMPIYIEQGGVDLPEVNWTSLFRESEISSKKLTLVFGNENRGVPEELLDNTSKNHIVSIPQRGVLRSFNVGVSSGIVMSDMKTKMNFW